MADVQHKEEKEIKPDQQSPVPEQGEQPTPPTSEAQEEEPVKTEEEGWIEVKKNKKKGKEVTSPTHEPKKKHHHNKEGGAVAAAASPSSSPTGASHQDDEIKERWNKEEEVLRTKLILTDHFPWSLAPIKKQEAGSSKPTNTWSQKLFPGQKKEDEGSKAQEVPLTLVGAAHFDFHKDRKQTPDTVAVAALQVCSFPDFQVLYERVREFKLSEPYVPNYLSWREVGPLAELLNELKEAEPNRFPQVLLVSGSAVLSPRGFGIAAHLGALLNVPTIGVAKKFIPIEGWNDQRAKKFAHDNLTARGEAVEITSQHDRSIVLGAALRLGDGPRGGAIVYVTAGHRVSLETAIDIVRHCSATPTKGVQPTHTVELKVKDELKKIDARTKPVHPGGRGKPNRGQPLQNGKGGGRGKGQGKAGQGQGAGQQGQGAGQQGHGAQGQQGQGRKQGQGAGAGSPQGGQGPRRHGQGGQGQVQQGGQQGRGGHGGPKKGGHQGANKGAPRGGKQGGGQANVWQTKAHPAPVGAQQQPSTSNATMAAPVAVDQQQHTQQAPATQQQQQHQGGKRQLGGGASGNKQQQKQGGGGGGGRGRQQQKQGGGGGNKQQQPRQQLQPKKPQQSSPANNAETSTTTSSSPSDHQQQQPAAEGAATTQ